MNLFYKLFPNQISDRIRHCLNKHQINAEEIRIRLGQPIVIRCAGNEYFCEMPNISNNDISHILLNATNGAFHSAIDSIQNGFLTLPNGCRLGICGEGSVLNHKIYNIRHINSLCLRIAAEKTGCADSIFSTYYESSFKNTIIISPPGIGKTTLLREFIRKLSENGYNIGVVDERGEISGTHQGERYFDLGQRTDVIYGIDKTKAASMLLRTMSPDIIAMDEVTAIQDLSAITEAVGCGVGLLTTIHGKDSSDLLKPSFKEILEINAFEAAIIIEVINNKRIYKMERLYV